MSIKPEQPSDGEQAKDEASAGSHADRQGLPIAEPAKGGTDAGSATSRGAGLVASVGTDSHPAEEAVASPAGTMTFQLLALAIVNLAVLLVAWLVTTTSDQKQTLPTDFIVVEIFIFVLSTLLCGLGFVVQGFAVVANDSISDDDEVREIITTSPQGFSAWWVQHRRPFLLCSVIVLSAAMLFALTRLVHTSGGGLRSPFMPLLEAPAILGPFIARRWHGIALSVVAVSVAVAYEIHTGTFATKASEYGKTGHIVVALLVIVVAGAISAGQKVAKRKRAEQARERRSHFSAEGAQAATI